MTPRKPAPGGPLVLPPTLAESLVRYCNEQDTPADRKLLRSTLRHLTRARREEHGRIRWDRVLATCDLTKLRAEDAADRIRKLPLANRTYGPGRVCGARAEGCSTKLSIYNKGNYCWQHEPVHNVRGARTAASQWPEYRTSWSS